VKIKNKNEHYAHLMNSGRLGKETNFILFDEFRTVMKAEDTRLKVFFDELYLQKIKTRRSE